MDIAIPADAPWWAWLIGVAIVSAAGILTAFFTARYQTRKTVHEVEASLRTDLKKMVDDCEDGRRKDRADYEAKLSSAHTQIFQLQQDHLAKDAQIARLRDRIAGLNGKINLLLIQKGIPLDFLTAAHRAEDLDQGEGTPS